MRRRAAEQGEKAQAAVIAAAEAAAKELQMSEGEMMQALVDFSQHQYLILMGAAGRSKDETLAAAKSFVTVWPPYIDAGKTIPQGRRIPKEAAVAGPSVQDITEVLHSLGLPCVTEPHKRYPRDFLAFGRVRVELTNPRTGKPWVPDVPTRRALLLKLAAAIPGLKSRKLREIVYAAEQQAQAEAAAAAGSSSSLAAAAAAAAAGGGGGGGGEEGAALDASGGGAAKANPKKKGKKGRKK